MDPHFITSDIVTQKGITFLMIPANKVLTDIKMDMPVLFHELFWNPSCTNLMEVKFVMDD
jgi:hypothetical protein